MLLDKNNYFSLEAQCAYMGFSQFKGFVKELGGCEAKSMAELKGEWTDKGKAVFLVGSYLHAYNEGTLDKFKANNPEIYTSKKMLKADYIKADKAIEVISKDTLFMRALSGQKEVIVTAELFGIPWKIQVDSLFENEKRFTDLKYLRSLDGKEWNKELHL